MGRPRVIRSVEEQAAMKARSREHNRERSREQRAGPEVRQMEVEANIGC